MKSVLIATAALVLASCGAPALPEAVDAPRVIAALEAYRNGDGAAVRATVADWDATHPAPPLRRPNLCSQAGYAERRLARLRGQLKALDERRVFSMSEEARLAYMEEAFLNAKPYPKAIPNIGSSDLCRSSPDFEEHERLDKAERVAVDKTYIVLRQAWWDDLRARHGERVVARMKNAGDLLRRNKLPGWNFANRLEFGRVG
jgi:hypothetical protein